MNQKEIDKMLKAYITNLGKYNEGDLVGKWVEFPCDEEEFNKHLEEIGIGSTDEFGQPYEEWFVTDYESGFVDAYDELGEYPSYEDLQELAEKCAELEDLDDTYGEGFVYNLCRESGYSIEDIIDKKDDMIIFEGDYGDDESAIAYYYVDSIGGPENLSKDTLETYFDYDALGRNLGFDTYENPNYDEDDPDSEEYISAGEYWCGDEYASDYDIGVAFVDEVGFDGVSNPDYYFDYKAFGRDCRIERNFYYVENDNYEHFWVEFR